LEIIQPDRISKVVDLKPNWGNTACMRGGRSGSATGCGKKYGQKNQERTSSHRMNRLFAIDCRWLEHNGRFNLPERGFFKEHPNCIWSALPVYRPSCLFRPDLKARGNQGLQFHPHVYAVYQRTQNHIQRKMQAL
jgi:hypothetical protein